MRKTLLFSVIVLFACVEPDRVYGQETQTSDSVESSSDLIRLVELDEFWAELARTVREGDFDAYKAACHEESVVVFTSGKNKVSYPMPTALANWEPGFNKTRAGEQKDNVEFRFSQRIGSETTAHETGIFHFTSVDSEGNVTSDQFIHFEALLLKRDGAWQTLMEYQKSVASKEEWEGMK